MLLTYRAELGYAEAVDFERRLAFAVLAQNHLEVEDLRIYDTLERKKIR